MNDEEREEWVENDEGLYDLQRRSGKGLRAWVRENRALIDSTAAAVASGAKPQHFLKYGARS